MYMICVIHYIIVYVSLKISTLLLSFSRWFFTGPESRRKTKKKNKIHSTLCTRAQYLLISFALYVQT